MVFKSFMEHDSPAETDGYFIWRTRQRQREPGRTHLGPACSSREFQRGEFAPVPEQYRSTQYLRVPQRIRLDQIGLRLT